jgi:hypothetical protein
MDGAAVRRWLAHDPARRAGDGEAVVYAGGMPERILLMGVE